MTALDLNEPQRTAVIHESGPLLVFAGAGSGKTRVITYRVANLIATHYVPPYRILAVTFTNKAAGEMRARLEQLAGPEVAGDLWVGTFHAICARLLRRYHADVGLERQFVIYDSSDQKALVTRVIKDHGLSERIYPPRWVLSRIHAQKREGVSPRSTHFIGAFDETLVELYEGYEKALAKANAVDFDDLILKIMRLAESADHPAGREIRERFSHILVDEFQDTNAIQYRLVRALAAGSQNLCVVGDDDQSIYSWRGANVRNILDFRRDFPSASMVKLEQNYRSTKAIVSAALGIIKSAAAREPKNLWSSGRDGDKVVVRAVRDERDEAFHVVRTAREEIARGVPGCDIAVFYRVHAQSRVLEEALRAEGLPYQIIGGMKFFERTEVKDLLSYLRLLDNPRSDADLVRVINVPARGIGQKTLDRLLYIASARDTSAYDAIDAALKSDTLKSGAKKKLGAFRDLVEQFRRDKSELLPHELCEAIIERTGYAEQLRNMDNAESDARLENLAELVGSIMEYEEECDNRGEAPSLAGYLERVSLVSDVDSMKDADALTLMTVHSAKGLEFTTVFLTGMEEETFPYRGLDGERNDEMDEERRLAYVAVTRARERLYITHASCRTLFGQTKYLAPSRFLADLPEEVTEQQGDPWGARAAMAYGRGSLRQPAAAEAPAAPRLAPGERVVEYDGDDSSGSEAGVEVRPGTRVHHERFGTGVVRSIRPGSTPAVTARFPGFGDKTISAEYLTFDV